MRSRDPALQSSRLVLLALFALSFASPALAQTSPPDLSQMSLEDLMQIDITSVSRREQPASDAAAAIYVITHDAIHRSGMSTIPDLLRLAPGVNVAQINSTQWAVSVRGFNGLFANKLLILIDGRTVYNRIFSGVFWDAENLMIDDIDRIEVIRGPGAAMWGANAVNGVINIVTKAPADTQGGLVRVDAGRMGAQGAVRYGGTIGAAKYRLYSQWTRLDQSLIAQDQRADDASHSVTGGFRADWTARPGALLLEGAFTAGQARAQWPAIGPNSLRTETQGGHVVGRWTQTRASGATLKIQSFVNVSSRQEPVGDHRQRTFDVDAQYQTAFGGRQVLVAGAGYRFIGEQFSGRAGYSLVPPDDRSSLVTAFIQDEIALMGDRLAVILGSQVQYDSDSGAGVQPTARAVWKGFPHQRLWAATSRALRTPSLIDRKVKADLPPTPGPGGLPLLVTVLGNPAARTEQLIDTEVGYRLSIGSSASIDVTGFAGRYVHLQTSEPSAPIVRFVPSPQIQVTTTFGNELEATTRGLEVVGLWQPTPVWRLDGTYTTFHLKPKLSATSRDPNAALEDGNAPRVQWRARSSFSPSTRATVDIVIFHAGPLDRIGIPAYTRTDLTAEWRFTNRLSAMVIGRNLFDAAHAEFGATLVQATQVARSASIRMRWIFP
jgi:iron complex outermembrane receptor protein